MQIEFEYTIQKEKHTP